MFLCSLDNADQFGRSMISKAQRGTVMSSPLAGRMRFSWTRTWSKVSKYLHCSITCSHHMYILAAHLSPFYFREHSKRILRGALYNDSKFLADINVMDYSLVVGVDSQRNELVVGIVGEFQSRCVDRDCCWLESDYIRTYTWDKKLESWVKESAFLGGAARGEPTIVTPKQYRQRFCSAMERYFPLVSSISFIMLSYTLTPAVRFRTVGWSKKTPLKKIPIVF